MKTRNLLLINLIFIFGLISCSRDIQYKVQFINKTEYNIHNLVFRFRDKDSTSVDPFQSTNIYTLNYKTSWGNFFSESFLLLYIRSYSDTLSNDTIFLNYGKMVSREVLEENIVNRIIIYSDSASLETMRFKFKVDK